MSDIYTFHKTVRGHLHIIKDIPCEDFSDSYSDIDGLFHIAVVADGHGASECCRSTYGSRAVTETALECMKDFALSIIDNTEWENDISMAQKLMIPKYQQSVIKQLTDTIISRWFNQIYEDINSNPLSETELDMAGSYADFYREGKKLEHIYGTTLIAALKISDYLILLQQGDGRCVVLFDDGSVKQPIPWDDRCYENVTTSLCDEDVVTSIRHCILDLRERNIIACYLGSDGVEDSYRNMEGTNTFYKRISCDLIDRDNIDFLEYLEDMLPEFSRTGSGDDVSVAGIVNVEHLSDFVEHFQVDIDKYEKSELLKRLDDKLSSMSRKHGILFRRMNEAKEKFDFIKTVTDIPDEEYTLVENQFKQALSEFNIFDAEYQKIDSERQRILEEI